MSTNSDRIRDLERQIEELKTQWPTHSVKPAMVQRLDELEEELEKAIEEAREGNAKADSRGGL